MKIKPVSIYILFFYSLLSCKSNKGDQKLAQEIREDYEALSIIHNTIKQEQKSFEIERDTLMKRFKDSKGFLAPEVPILNEKFQKSIFSQDEIIERHHQVLGSLAELEDHALNNLESKEELLKDKKRILQKEKKVRNDYQTLLNQRKALLQEYDSLLNNTSQ